MSFVPFDTCGDYYCSTCPYGGSSHCLQISYCASLRDEVWRAYDEGRLMLGSSDYARLNETQFKLVFEHWFYKVQLEESLQRVFKKAQKYLFTFGSVMYWRR